MNTSGGALAGPADHRHNPTTLDRITGISADRLMSNLGTRLLQQAHEPSKCALTNGQSRY
jgi:hypothetical protein